CALPISDSHRHPVSPDARTRSSVSARHGNTRPWRRGRCRRCRTVQLTQHSRHSSQRLQRLLGCARRRPSIRQGFVQLTEGGREFTVGFHHAITRDSVDLLDVLDDLEMLLHDLPNRISVGRPLGLELEAVHHGSSGYHARIALPEPPMNLPSNEIRDTLDLLNNSLEVLAIAVDVDELFGPHLQNRSTFTHRRQKIGHRTQLLLLSHTTTPRPYYKRRR